MLMCTDKTTIFKPLKITMLINSHANPHSIRLYQVISQFPLKHTQTLLGDELHMNPNVARLRVVGRDIRNMALAWPTNVNIELTYLYSLSAWRNAFTVQWHEELISWIYVSDSERPVLMSMVWYKAADVDGFNTRHLHCYHSESTMWKEAK